MNTSAQLARARHTRISSKHRTAQSETGVLTRSPTARARPPLVHVTAEESALLNRVLLASVKIIPDPKATELEPLSSSPQANGPNRRIGVSVGGL